MVRCKQCGRHEVEAIRETWATPVCFACLPPPTPLPIARLRTRCGALVLVGDSEGEERCDMPVPCSVHGG